MSHIVALAVKRGELIRENPQAPFPVVLVIDQSVFFLASFLGIAKNTLGRRNIVGWFISILKLSGVGRGLWQ